MQITQNEPRHRLLPDASKIKDPALYNLFDKACQVVTFFDTVNGKSIFYNRHGLDLLRAGQAERAKQQFERSLNIALPAAKRGGVMAFWHYFNTMVALQGLLEVHDHLGGYKARSETASLIARYQRDWHRYKRLGMDDRE